MRKKLHVALALATAVSAVSAAPALAQDPLQEAVDCTWRALGTYTDCDDITVSVAGHDVATVHTDVVYPVGDTVRRTNDEVVTPIVRLVLGDDPCNPAGVRICL